MRRLIASKRYDVYVYNEDIINDFGNEEDWYEALENNNSYILQFCDFIGSYDDEEEALEKTNDFIYGRNEAVIWDNQERYFFN